MDTGKTDNPLRLPAFPYETALAIQDRMFKQDGQLFYPAFPGDINYNNSGHTDHNDTEMMMKMRGMWGGGRGMMEKDMTTMKTTMTTEDMANGIKKAEWSVDSVEPSVMADFFGDHMLVNGKIWPKMNVEPRQYRLRLLNGCDSRFLVLEFHAKLGRFYRIVKFLIIGGDQGFATDQVVERTRVVMEPGSRLDVIIDFGTVDFGNNPEQRVVLKNFGGDKVTRNEMAHVKSITRYFWF